MRRARERMRERKEGCDADQQSGEQHSPHRFSSNKCKLLHLVFLPCIASIISSFPCSLPSDVSLSFSNSISLIFISSLLFLFYSIYSTEVSHSCFSTYFVNLTFLFLKVLPFYFLPFSRLILVRMCLLFIFTITSDIQQTVENSALRINIFYLIF